MNSPSPPYSQCDAKGRCIRHPTIQMSRKKKLGGWKKLTAICPLCAMELMSMSNAIIHKDNNDVVASLSSSSLSKDGRVVDGGSIPSSDIYCGNVGGGSHSSPPPPPSSSSPSSSSSSSSRSSPPSSRSRSRMEPPSDSVSLHSNSSSPQQQLRRQRRAPQVGHQDPQDDNRSVYSARSAPSTYNGHNNNQHQQHHQQQQHYHQQRSPPSQQQQQQQQRVSIASKQTSNLSASDSSCESTVDMSYESELSSSASNLNFNNNNYHNSRPSLRRVDSTGSASVFSQSSRGSVRSSSSATAMATTSTSHSPGSSGGRRHGNHANRQQQAPQQPQQQQQHRGHHSPIDAPPIDDNYGRQTQEQFVCGMELFVNDTRCFYTGQIHMDTQLPHGLGTLRSESGRGMSEGQWHFGRLVQESNGGGGRGRGVAPPPPPPPQVNLGVPSLGSPSNYPRHVISRDCQEEDGMPSPLGYPVEEEEYYREDHYQEDYHHYHHHQEEYQEEEEGEQQQQHVNYCLPCTSSNEEEEEVLFLCNDLREQCQVEDESSIAEPTVVGEEYDEGSETDSQESSYTARESKSYLSSSSSSSSSRSNTTHDKLHEYKRYIVTCDEEENYYHDEQGRAVYSRQQYVGNDYERPTRRVRFQEDP